MMKKGIKKLLASLVLGLCCAVSIADEEVRDVSAEKPAADSKSDGDYTVEKRGDTTIKYKKKATYDFEGTSIDGIHNKPSGSYISNIKDVKGKSIIRIRENFDAEVADSARLVR